MVKAFGNCLIDFCNSHFSLVLAECDWLVNFDIVSLLEADLAIGRETL